MLNTSTLHKLNVALELLNAARNEMRESESHSLIHSMVNDLRTIIFNNTPDFQHIDSPFADEQLLDIIRNVESSGHKAIALPASSLRANLEANAFDIMYHFPVHETKVPEIGQ